MLHKAKNPQKKCDGFLNNENTQNNQSTLSTLFELSFLF